MTSQCWPFNRMSSTDLLAWNQRLGGINAVRLCACFAVFLCILIVLFFAFAEMKDLQYKTSHVRTHTRRCMPLCGILHDVSFIKNHPPAVTHTSSSCPHTANSLPLRFRHKPSGANHSDMLQFPASMTYTQYSTASTT